MDVEATISEMVVIAQERLTKYEALVSLAEEQRQILIANNHSELMDNLAKQDAVLAELAKLDKKEQLIVPDMGNSADQRSIVDQTVASINAMTAEVAAKLRSLISTNKLLLNNTLSFIKFSMGVITRLAGEQQAYNPAGASSGNVSMILDSRV